jgi:hypothetical protein
MAKSPSAKLPELDDRTWDELEVLPHNDGTLLFKDRIRKRVKSGAFEDVPVRVRIVRPMQIAQARAEARQLFATIGGLDPERDADVFRELEQLCIMAHAIRHPDAPHGQFCTAEELGRDYDEGSLWDLKGRIEALRLMMDPRESNMGPDETWGRIAAIATKGNLLPLADIAGHEQASFTVFMASQALKSPTGVAWLQSFESSTRAPSTSNHLTQSSVEPG